MRTVLVGIQAGTKAARERDRVFPEAPEKEVSFSPKFS